MIRQIIRPFTPEARQRLTGIRPERSPFASTWTATTDLLDRELWALGVRTEYVLMIDVEERDMKLNGELRASARPASSAVAIAFTARNLGDLMFACGKFREWHDNVRAIALGLEALRKVDRYGITKSAEQYRGWSALPPGTPMPPAAMTIGDAIKILEDFSGVHIDTNKPASLTFAWRKAAWRTHPDQGGNETDFKRVNAAVDLLRATTSS
jgi:hypothetical protein